jgi:hypothetical protein
MSTYAHKISLFSMSNSDFSDAMCSYENRINTIRTDIPQMAGPPGRLRGSLLAVRRPLQRRKRRDGARGQRHRPVIAVRPEILLGRATNERSCPADSQRRQ